MHTFRRFTRCPAQASAWLLALALLLSAGWGQMHRVLHAGAQTHSPMAVQTAEAMQAGGQGFSASGTAGLADEDGSSLCKLLDQLSLGAGATTSQAPVVPAPQPVVQALAPLRQVYAATGRRFDARGPPLTA